MTTVDTAITKPGLYDIPADVYHADPVPEGSLSSSGARRLLPPDGCPALFRYERDHGQTPRRVFEIGHAAHAEALGTGPELVDMGEGDWRTKEIKAKVADARERGAVPLKTPEYQHIRAMAAALREHPVAGPLLAPGVGQAERSMFWRDPATGTWLRARPDLLVEDDTQLLVVDYKTTESAAPAGLPRVIDNRGYYQQAAWYLDATGGAAFLLIFQEKTPPYLVTVAQVDPVALKIGKSRNREAIDLYVACVASGRWPGYSDDIELVRLPPYTEAKYTKEQW